MCSFFKLCGKYQPEEKRLRTMHCRMILWRKGLLGPWLYYFLRLKCYQIYLMLFIAESTFSVSVFLKTFSSFGISLCGGSILNTFTKPFHIFWTIVCTCDCKRWLMRSSAIFYAKLADEQFLEIVGADLANRSGVAPDYSENCEYFILYYWSGFFKTVPRSSNMCTCIVELEVRRLLQRSLRRSTGEIVLLCQLQYWTRSFNKNGTAGNALYDLVPDIF